MIRKYTEEELRLAIQAAREFHYIEDFTPDQIIANINDLQDAMEDSDWISIEGHLLPENCVAVLCFNPKYISNEYWNPITIQDLVDKDGKRLAPDVTHWQYLPTYPINIPSNSDKKIKLA